MLLGYDILGSGHRKGSEVLRQACLVLLVICIAVFKAHVRYVTAVHCNAATM